MFYQKIIILALILVEGGNGQNVLGYFNVKDDGKTKIVDKSFSVKLPSPSSLSQKKCGISEDAKYHLDTACDRESYNKYRDSLDRPGVHKRLQPTGNSNVPDEKTVFCPEEVADLTSPTNQEGFDMVWLVENTASTPIVVAVVNEGIEYSAYDASIAPPNLDPKAVLQPGEWSNYYTHEGRVFHVRSLLEDGTMGPILLQHRAGLIPITNKYGSPLSCGIHAAASVDRKVDADQLQRKLAKMLSKKVKKAADVAEIKKVIKKLDPEPHHPENANERHPNYSRTLAPPLRHCNELDVGFRNKVGCPVHAYYTGTQGANTKNGKPACDEEFKFHLGLDSHSKDFYNDWESTTKYERSYADHTYVFRLASDTSILLDQVTLQPTYINDCPNLKQKQKTKAISEAIQIDVTKQEQHGDKNCTSNDVIARTMSIETLLLSSLKGLNSTELKDYRGTRL